MPETTPDAADPEEGSPKKKTPSKQEASQNAEPSQDEDYVSTKKRPIANLPRGVSARSVTIRGRTYCQVRLGRKFLGKQANEIIRTFAKRKDAKKWIEEQEADQTARYGMQLSPDQIASAKSAFSRLGDIPLDDVVDFYFDSGPGNRPTITLAAATAQYLENLREGGWKAASVIAQKISLNVLLNDLGDKPLIWFTPERLHTWLQAISRVRKWGDRNKCNYYRDYHMFFGFCARREWIPKNPLESYLFEAVTNLKQKLAAAHVIEIYSPEEAWRLNVCEPLLRPYGGRRRDQKNDGPPDQGGPLCTLRHPRPETSDESFLGPASVARADTGQALRSAAVSVVCT